MSHEPLYHHPLGDVYAITQAKVAMIRRPGIPLDGAPYLYLNCPCGAEPATTVNGPTVTCACGKVYDAHGYRLQAA